MHYCRRISRGHTGAGKGLSYFCFVVFAPPSFCNYLIVGEYAVKTEVQHLTQRSVLAPLALITLVVFTLARSFIFLTFQFILDTMNGGKKC